MKKIAILGAMEAEITPILEKLQNVKETKYAGNIYYEGTYNDRDIVLAYSKIGKVFAAITATILIEKFKCDVLLFSGVAGGISEDLKIGDLIIADKLCQHDVDITAFGHPHGFIPESILYSETDETLRDIAKYVALDKDIEIKMGTIATGDQFIACEDKKNWISETFVAHALEMEGAAVAVVCSSFEIPYFILRSISDTADTDANFNFEEFVESSAKRSADFILAMIDEI